MNEFWILWSGGLAVMLGLGFVTWLYSLVNDDVSIVDSLWSLMFLAGALYYASSADTLSPTAILMLVMVSLWSLRLALFLTLRNWGEPEDRRYREIRANNEPHFRFKSLYIVFGLQALLAWIISVPLLPVAVTSADIGVIQILALCLWLSGFLIESIADLQLYRFKSNPDNTGKVLDSGLWRYSRHPNYFGETLVWWGYYLLAVSVGAWWSVFAPLLMTFLLLKVSGVSLMEKDISGRRAAYRDYIESTNAFIPGKPRKSRLNPGGVN